MPDTAAVVIPAGGAGLRMGHGTPKQFLPLAGVPVIVHTIRALAAIGDPRALEGLGRFRARFQLFPPAVEERRELYRTLPAYPEGAYDAWIESGLRSRDAEIRRLSAAMGPGPGGGA